MDGFPEVFVIPAPCERVPGKRPTTRGCLISQGTAAGRRGGKVLEKTISGYAPGVVLANESLLELREGKFTRRRKGAKEEKRGLLVRGGGWIRQEQGCGDAS